MLSAHPARRGRRTPLGALLILVALLATILPLQSTPVAASQSIREPGDVAPVRSSPARRAASDPEDVALFTPELEHPIQDDVFYFVLPDRFNDADPSNNTGGIAGGPLANGYLPTDSGYYHGGDIKGIIRKLDYIQNLGVTAIWMAPIFKNRPVQGDGTLSGSSAGYHGYWITDFTQVDPHFGTNADLRALVRAAHARGIKVFFDIIANHTADIIDYREGTYDYISKQAEPYRDASGRPFDDRAYAGTDSFPPLDPNVSFPYTPVFRTPEDATIKRPDWLNNPIYYHNRGNSTFSGENAEYGDFFGLDDLFTEHPRVVDGMTDVYRTWIREFGIDGYRIDTVKHVNMEFWQRFSPAMLEYAAQRGNRDFFMFGEVFSGYVPFLSEYTTRGRLPAVLDFAFQEQARRFASQSQSTEELRNLFQQDDLYTDADSNAYRLPTFLGNHDIGRIGYFLEQDNPGAGDAELLARDKLAHALMYFSRGVPVIYYGDEQGFTGDGGDKGAREDMFGSQVASYNDNDLIGTDATTARPNFDPSHPLYRALRTYAEIRREHAALRRGAQIQRYSSAQPGVYAFSRITTEKAKQIEYVLAFNNAETPRTATFSTYQPHGRFAPVYPATNRGLRTDRNGRITVTVPPLSFVIYKAQRDLPKHEPAPGIRITAPSPDEVVTRRVEVRAELSDDRYAEVTFAVKAGSGPSYKVIGTDDSPPYRVFYDVSGFPAGTRLTFKAIANDRSDDAKKSVGQLTSATVTAVVGAPSSRTVRVTFNVTVPPGTDATGKAVHIAGELNLLDPDLPAWDPGAVALTRVDSTHWTITLTGKEGTVVNYKYTLGSWDYVEKSESCSEIGNRVLTVTYGESGNQVVNDTVANWRNVPPCGS